MLLLKAIIKNIFRNKVVLSYNGKDQILVKKNDDITNAFVNRQEIKKSSKKDVLDVSVKNIANLAKQIEVSPYFLADNKVGGMMIKNLKDDSILKKIGFKKGDIIKHVNGVPIKSMKEALYIYSQIKGKEDMDVVLNREGIEKKILVTIEKD